MKRSSDVEPLALHTIHPDLDNQIQDALDQIVTRFQDESPRLDKSVRTARIQVTVDITYTLADRRVEVVASTKTNLPGYRAVSAVKAWLPHAGTRILVEQDDPSDQLSFTTNPKDTQ